MMIKRILSGAAVALALLLPVTAIAANHPDARGGEGWWPQVADPLTNATHKAPRLAQRQPPRKGVASCVSRGAFLRSGECGAEDCWGRLAEPPKRAPGSEDVCGVPELDFLDDGGLPASRPDGVAGPELASGHPLGQ